MIKHDRWIVRDLWITLDLWITPDLWFTFYQWITRDLWITYAGCSHTIYGSYQTTPDLWVPCGGSRPHDLLKLNDGY